MSLKHGLNLKKVAPPLRRPLLDEEDGEDDDDEVVGRAARASDHESNGASKSKRDLSQQAKPGPPPRRRKELDIGQDLSALGAAKAQVQSAQAVDSAIFDYDSFHEAKTSVTEAKQAAARQDAIERKPKYINNLLDAAARRKQDQLLAREKLLQREREAEGDEFADKEKFVTGAYKLQQEEAKRLAEEEKRKAEVEEQRKRKMGGGMQGFYKTMMDQSERQHQEAMEATALLEQGGVSVPASARTEKEKSDAQLAAELKAKGVKVHLNEEGQITDKRDLLSAGLNIAPSAKSSDSRSGADHLRSSNRHTQTSAFSNRGAGGQQAQRERQSKIVEEQLAAQVKRAREKEEAERQRLEQAAKSQKTQKDVSDAKARYLARKAAKERGED